MKKHLGVDIDGVITNMQDYVFEYGSKLAYKNGYDLKNMDKIHYDTRDLFSWETHIDNEFWHEQIEYYSIHERARAHASEVLYKLKEDGWKIFLITARRSFKEEHIKERRIENILIDWLERYDIPYDVLEFSRTDKREALKKYEIDVMIEDSPDNIEQLRHLCPIIVFDAMYNKQCVGEGIHRVNSWYEILYYLQEFEKENNK